MRAGNRKDNKLVRIRNMLNRKMLKYRWQQWVANIKYQQDKEDGFELAEKIFKKRKLSESDWGMDYLRFNSEQL